MRDAPIRVHENGKLLSYSVEDLTKYHGVGFPGGVAHAFKVLQRAIPLLSPDGPPERREIDVETSFGGPGGRDAIEMVTRAVSRDRYVVDKSLGARWAGDGHRENYFFRFSYRGSVVSLVIQPGLVRDAFVALGRKPDRTPDEDARLAALKRDMAERMLALEPEDAYVAVYTN